MLLHSALVAVVILAALHLPHRASGACGQKRGCNPPVVYRSVSFVTGTGNGAPTYAASTGFKADHTAAITAGVDAVRNFWGSNDNAMVVQLEVGGAASAYTGVFNSMCTFLDRGQCSQATTTWGQGDYEKAKTGGGGSFYATTGNDVCTCDEWTTGKSAMIMIPGTNDAASGLFDRAVHEYTHIVQATIGGPAPSWLQEGAAVFMECLMATQKGTHGSKMSMSDCFKFGGGRGGILRKVQSVYGNTNTKGGGAGTKWLSLYGTDWACGSDIPPYQVANPFPKNDAGTESDHDLLSGIIYDAGALAVVFAVKRANAAHAADGGRTFVDFFRGTGAPGKGFYPLVKPYPVNTETGWPSDVPEGQGWRKALSDFTGDATSAAFFEAFEAAVRPQGAGGDVASEDTMLSWLEADSFYEAQAASATTLSSLSARNACPAPVTGCPAGQEPVRPAKTACAACGTGKFKAATDASSCASCTTAGQVPNVAKTACAWCPAGKQASSTTAGACDVCPAGTIKATAATAVCTACAVAGEVSNVAKTACQAPTQVTGCPAGQAPNAAGTECEGCPAGKVKISTDLSACTVCGTAGTVPKADKTGCEAAPASSTATGGSTPTTKIGTASHASVLPSLALVAVVVVGAQLGGAAGGGFWGF